MVGIARSRHREPSFLGIGESLGIRFLRGCGIEYLEDLQRQGVQNLLADARTPCIVGMCRNRDAAGFFYFLENFFGRLFFEVGQRGADAKHVSLRRADFDSWDEQKIVGNRATAQVFMSLAGIMVGDGDTAESTLLRRGNQILRRVAGILGKKGMHMKIESLKHEWVYFRY